MLKPIRTVAILGAGVMGSQIAAHLANAGLSVHLLDIASAGEDKNQIVESAFKRALKLSPPIFFTEKTARRVTLGNFDQHFDRLKTVDWVIEVIVEDLKIKQELMARIEATVKPNTIVSTNTSGLPVAKIVEGRSESFKRYFLGTHFFNPPRYLKLLELIPTPDTAPLVLAKIKEFGRIRLGKGIVVAKDTPNFIANRVGVFATMLGFQTLEEGYTIPEIDVLTGTLVGRPKSATFRTADLVGLDVLSLVIQHLYHATPMDERHELFAMPAVLQGLVAAGALGAKTGAGFYQKVKGEILSLNPLTRSYESQPAMNLGDVDKIAKVHDLGDRLRQLYADQGRAGEFFRKSTLLMLNYCAHRVPGIADDFVDIDRALCWGFGWEMGPFAMWDQLGFTNVMADMQAAGMVIPTWVFELQTARAEGFYASKTMLKMSHNMLSHNMLSHNMLSDNMLSDNMMTSMAATYGGEMAIGNEMSSDSTTMNRPLAPNSGGTGIKAPRIGDLDAYDEIHLDTIKADPDNILWQNSEAALLDLGYGVALYEFRSKGNTLSMKVLEGLDEVMTLVERGEFRGLVIGNDSANFCGGANLAEMAMMAKSDMAMLGNIDPAELVERSAISGLIEKFQGLLQRIYYSPYPIVGAIQGRALGGGAELVMAMPHVVAAAESYIGLVELSVGLIPGAGGIMRMVSRATKRAASEMPSHILPFLRTAFETIATAKVSSSAYEAQELGFLPADAVILMNGDRRIFVAKEEVLRLDREGYCPPVENNAIMLLGKPARAMLDYAAYVFEQGGYASEYDRFLANKLAYVMTGGELSAPAIVPESYLLQLERETFVPLLQQPKTQERIAAMLTMKKPLRN
jgi:3-hydroxyacyl-CoA dehydrogenase